MKIYILKNLFNSEYYHAEFSRIGTWSKEIEYCEKCQYSDQHLIEPLQIEWEPDSDIIGDITWGGFTIIVLENVKNFLIDNNFLCEFGRVDVKKPTTPKRRRKIVSFPYEGPTLSWIKSTPYINLDIVKSKLEIKEDCTFCKRIDYKFKMNDLVIPKKELKTFKMFRINQFGKSAATFITEQGLEEFLKQNFSNFRYEEAGYVD